MENKTKLKKEDATLISKILNQINYTEESKIGLFNDKIACDWIFQTHPKAWKSGIYLRYIYDKPLNTVIKANEVKSWVVNRFGVLGFVERLNIVKQKQKRTGKKGSWFFTEKENYMIISPFKPVIKYLNHLKQLMILSNFRNKDTIFKVRFNSLETYANYIKSLDLQKILDQKAPKKNERVIKLLKKRKLEETRALQKQRIQNIIKSEKRVFKLYGYKARSCSKCFMASYPKESKNCPFCGHNEFKNFNSQKII